MKSPLLTLLITLNYAHTLGMKNSLMKRDSMEQFRNDKMS